MGLFWSEPKAKAPKKTPKPDKWMGNIPQEHLLEFYELYGDQKAFSENFKLQKAKLWQFIGRVLPAVGEEGDTSDDPHKSKMISLKMDLNDERVLIVPIYRTFPGEFLEDEKKEEEPTGQC